MAESLKALLKQQEELAAKIEAVRAEGKAKGIEQIKSIMAELGIGASDLGFYDVATLPNGKAGPRTFKQRKPMPPSQPKYRDPATGSTWSGRGKPPRWLQGDRDAYLIGKEQAKAA
jgi:DNA-binding protein H-NS